MLEGQQSSRDPVALSAMADRAGGLLGSRGGLGERVSRIGLSVFLFLWEDFYEENRNCNGK